MNFKNYLFAFNLVLIYCFCNPAKAQEDLPLNVIKTNPLTVLWSQIPFTGEFRIMYERAEGEKLATQIGISYIGPSALLNIEKLADEFADSNANISGINIRGVRFQLAQKFYLTKDFYSPKGFYIAPMVSYNTARLYNEDNTNDYLSATFLNVNGLIGYQIIGGGSFAFDIFTGLGFKANTWKTSSATSSFKEDLGTNTGIKVTLGFNAGLAF